jgi:CBS domain-containing protein
VGDVLVCDGERLLGIVTDRDLVVRCLAEEDEPAALPIGEICSRNPFTVTPEDDVDDVVELMKERAVRRVPVVGEEGALVGIVSLGDLAERRDRESALGRISAAPPNR